MYRPHAVIHSSDSGHLGCFHCISNHFQAFLQRLEKHYISQEKRKGKRKERKLMAIDMDWRSVRGVISNSRSKFQCLKKVRFLSLFFPLL